MATIADLCAATSTACGADRAHVDLMAAAVGMAPDSEATIAKASTLVIALLSAAMPSEARDRVAIYSALPLTHVSWMNLPGADGSSRNLTIEAADFQLSPGAGATVTKFSRSFADAIAFAIDHHIRRLEPDLGIYMIRALRRSHSPLAFIGLMREDRSEEILLYRRTVESEESYTIASFQLSVCADIHGVVLKAIADLLRGSVPEAHRENAAAALAAAQGQYP